MLDKEHFHVVAGEDVSDVLDKRMAIEVPMLYSLTQWQEQTHSEGYVAAELVHSMYGWTLRYATGLENFGIIHRTGSEVFEHAVWLAVRWQQQDPTHRYVFVRRSALT